MLRLTASLRVGARVAAPRLRARLMPSLTHAMSSMSYSQTPPAGFEEDEDMNVPGPKMSDAEIKAFRNENQITVLGDTSGIDITPIQDFADLVKTTSDGEVETLPKKVLRFIAEKKYEGLTPIQAQSLPISIAGRDLIGVAQTGSGKTMGFLIPLLWEAMNVRRDDPSALGPLAVILAPTRELAQQIEMEARPIAKAFGSTTVCIFGGASRMMQQRQIGRMGRRLDVVVATPGRLVDFLEDKTLLLNSLRFLVLDEADRMLDMGFEPQLRSIIGHIHASEGEKERQTLMFSATWPKEVQQLAHDFLSNPVRIHVGESDKLVANSDITQIVELHTTVISRLDAANKLISLMQEKAGKDVCHTVIFANRKRDVDMIAEDIRENSRVFTAALHGDMTQGRRDSMLNAIKTGRAQVLVATDVAARGLDVKTIRQVINFDMPLDMESYIHRIGRTGRAGMKGTAYTFVHPEQDESHIPKLCKVLKESNQEISPELQDLNELASPKKFESRSFRAGGRRVGGGGYGGRGGGGYGGGGFGGGGY
ncbi:hypothetical protein AB1Y20_017704 [Prymnesium parvum]